MEDYAYLMLKSFLTAWRDPTGVGTYAVIAAVTMIGIGVLYILTGLIRLFRYRKKAVYAKAKRAIRMKILELKGKRMSGKERDEYVRLLVEDALTTTMEELYFLNLITLDEKQAYYKKLAREAGLNGICSYLDADTKEQIKRRVKKMDGKVIPFPKDDQPSLLKKLGKLSTGKLFGRKKTA